MGKKKRFRKIFKKKKLYKKVKITIIGRKKKEKYVTSQDFH